jgi:protein phosphatase
MAGTAVSYIEVAALSDPGRIRNNNEDNFGYDEENKIFVVCDGMGGMAAGEVASSVAVEDVLRAYRELDRQPFSLQQRLHDSIASANELVWTMAQFDSNLRGMGSTLVAVCAQDSEVVIGNVGDSRAYFLRNGYCSQVTEDHSCAAEYRKQGGSAGWPCPPAQIITRAIGGDAQVQPDFYAATVETGDLILLTTDGLTRYVDEAQLGHVLAAKDDLPSACRELVEIALRHGAADNVTCLLLRFR